MGDQPAEDLYELRTTSTVCRALGEVLPEAVAAAAYEFISGPPVREPYRVGKRLLPPMDDRFSARRGTYRIICRIGDKNRLVTVVDIDHQNWQAIGRSDRNRHAGLAGQKSVAFANTSFRPIGNQHPCRVNLFEGRHAVLG